MNFEWVDDDTYDPANYEGYETVNPGTIVYYGEGWGSFSGKYEELRGGYVKLNADGTLSAADPGVREAEDEPVREAWKDLPINPTKLVAATIGHANTGRKLVAGGAKLCVAFGVETGSGFTATLPAGIVGAWGVWDVAGATAAFRRANQQWNEAFNEKLSDASWKNFYGPLPYAQLYDDPTEPGAVDFWKQKLKTWYQRPLEFIQEIGSAVP
jgi:hypothetical protein